MGKYPELELYSLLNLDEIRCEPFGINSPAVKSRPGHMFASAGNCPILQVAFRDTPHITLNHWDYPWAANIVCP